VTPGPSLRASDADRDRVADLLREHTAHGRLTIEEFSERVGAAYAATTRRELDRLIVDLPVALPDPHEAALRPQAGIPRMAPITMPSCVRDIPLTCLVFVLIIVVLA
jgi:hypothetical protein